MIVIPLLNYNDNYNDNDVDNNGNNVVVVVV